jgi:formylglycine-generating enzyme required for sulfatase activity
MIQVFNEATGLRFPTEAEWEYAYRAGTTTAFHASSDHPNGTDDDANLEIIAWIGSNSAGQTRPVGQKPANGLGMHDMSGNVWELVNDWYSQNYYATSPGVNPTGPASGSERIARGAAWADVPNGCRSSFRWPWTPSGAWYSAGFRAARTP